MAKIHNGRWFRMESYAKFPRVKTGPKTHVEDYLGQHLWPHLIITHYLTLEDFSKFPKFTQVSVFLRLKQPTPR